MIRFVEFHLLWQKWILKPAIVQQASVLKGKVYHQVTVPNYNLWSKRLLIRWENLLSCPMQSKLFHSNHNCCGSVSSRAHQCQRVTEERYITTHTVYRTRSGKSITHKWSAARHQNEQPTATLLMCTTSKQRNRLHDTVRWLASRSLVTDWLGESQTELELRPSRWLGSPPHHSVFRKALKSVVGGRGWQFDNQSNNERKFIPIDVERPRTL